VIEVGGPEVLTFAELLIRIRRACGRRGGRQLSIPIGPARALLNLAGRVAGGLLPLHAGQLAPFVIDGVAAPNSVYEKLRPGMAALDALLARTAHAT
jgi:hypothetical protein